MGGGDEEVKGEAPVAEDGEVGKGLFDGVAAAFGGGVSAGVADDEEADDKGVEALFSGVSGMQCSGCYQNRW